MSITSITALIGMITGIIGLGFSLFSFFHSRATSVNEYLSELCSADAISSRHHIYTSETDEITIDDEKASYVVNFYHRWGIMAKHGYLPMWVFDDGNVIGILAMYNKLSDYIDNMRKNHKDEDYAYGFEYLVKKIKKRNRLT